MARLVLCKLALTIVTKPRIYKSFIFDLKLIILSPWSSLPLCPCFPSSISFHFLQVVGAKVVTNAKSPGARCYGFVTMSSTEEATKCISHLHRTELHGRMISVERVSVGGRFLLHRSVFIASPIIVFPPR